MKVRAIDPKGAGKIATYLCSNAPQGIIVQQNKANRIRITVGHNRSGKSIWVEDQSKGLSVVVNGGNIKRYYGEAYRVFGRKHDSEYEKGPRTDRIWKKVLMNQVVALMHAISETGVSGVSIPI